MMHHASLAGRDSPGRQQGGQWLAAWLLRACKREGAEEWLALAILDSSRARVVRTTVVLLLPVVLRLYLYSRGGELL